MISFQTSQEKEWKILPFSSVCTLFSGFPSDLAKRHRGRGTKSKTRIRFDQKIILKRIIFTVKQNEFEHFYAFFLFDAIRRPKENTSQREINKNKNKIRWDLIFCISGAPNKTNWQLQINPEQKTNPTERKTTNEKNIKNINHMKEKYFLLKEKQK